MDWVYYNRSSGVPVIDAYPGYPIDAYVDEDGTVFVIVAVGNVVVAGYVPADSEQLSARELDNMNTETFATGLAELGIDRVIRLAGYAP